MSSINSAHLLETPEAQHPKAGKVVEIGQSATKGFITDEDLLYATGLLLGDGFLSAVPNRNCKTLHKACGIGSMDLDIIKEFKRIVEETFGCSTKIYSPKGKDNFYEYRTSKGIVFDYFAANTAHKTKFPDSLKYATNKEKLAFLAGLLDSDGFASMTNNKARIDKNGYYKKARKQFRMGFTNTRFIMELTDLLDKLEIKYGKIWVNNHQTDHIKGRKVGKQLTRYTVPINPISFVINGGYFKCRRKQERLKEYLDGIQSRNPVVQRLHAERLCTMV